MNHCQFDRANLQNLCAHRGHFEHFLERDLFQPLGLRDDPRIGRVDPVHVCVNIAAFGIDRGCDGDGAGVRATPAQRRKPSCRLMNALKACNHCNFVQAHEMIGEGRSVHANDSGRAMRVIGADRDLPSLPRSRGNAHIL